MTSKVAIISQALTLLGQSPVSDISNFPGNNKIYAAANVLYDTLLLGLLSERQPWRFAMASKELNLLVAAPPMPQWEKAFQLPTDPNFIMCYRVYDGTTDITRYEIYENKLYTDEGTIWMDYTFAPDPDGFPPYFVKLLMYELAAHLAMAVTHEINIVKVWGGEAKAQKLIARSSDSAQTPNKRIPDGPIFAAHFSTDPWVETGRIT